MSRFRAQPRGVFETVLRWIIFSVGIALIPLVVSPVIAFARGTPLDLLLFSSHGELLIVSAAISAAAIGQLIGSGRNLILAKVFCGGFCVVMAVLVSILFGDFSSTIKSDGVIDPHRVTVISAIVFGFTIASSGSSVALAEV